MSVVSNNIANVNTIGFKSQRMDFQDFIYQDGYSASGPTQIGRGVSVNCVLGDFSQGSFETTNSSMDMAIGGNGYFQVRDPHSEQVYYTRAGDFNWDAEGYLKNPQGFILQGWAVDNSTSPTLATGATPTVSNTSVIRGTGVPVDIQLETWVLPPKQTTKVQMVANLTSDPGYNRTKSTTTPFFGLSERWDGTQPPTPAGAPPLADDAYAYSIATKVYDEGGTAHTVTTYFDQIDSDTLTNLPTGYKVYEYIVTMDPAEDLRTFGGTYDPATGILTGATRFNETDAGGLLMRGTITFNSAGQIVNQTAYTYMGNTASGDDSPYTANPEDLSSWQPTAVSNNGYPVCVANFTGQPMANGVRQTSGTTFPDAENYLIEIDFGLQCIGDLNNPWTSTADASTVGTDYSALGSFVKAEKEENASTNLSGSSVTRYNYQDGYSYGDLTQTSVDRDGVISGVYSNGITLPLYQVTLYDFVCEQGLRREGGNLFAATLKSGNPQVGPANENGMGSVNGYAIEQSNVDLAREFVQMITTQRGFQANSKGVTTVDQMLETVIGMKR